MRTIALTAVLTLSLTSCTGEAGHDTKAAAAAAPRVAAKVPAGPLGNILTEAEVLRQTLADDRTDTLAASAAKLDADVTALLAQPTKTAGADTLAAASKSLVDVTSAAEVDIKAVRLAYGELQKSLVAVIAGDATLQAGRFLFECPMARGYQRWVQLAPKMANPYMGKRMLECGSAIEGWKVAG